METTAQSTKINTQSDSALSTYDMYLLDNGGIPLFAGCTISDYCMQHQEQHPLHTGFIAAIQSFGNEVFSGYPQKLNFGHLKLTLKNEGSFTVVFVNPEDADDNLIRDKMDKISTLFKEKYEKNIHAFYVTDELSKNFEDDMIKLGLVPQGGIKSTKEYFITEKGQTSQKSASLLGRFKQKFISMIKK
ncbi:MAG: hypothetical protein ACXAC7_05540 [Candidatus Hodarchaeales archaeon]